MVENNSKLRTISEEEYQILLASKYIADVIEYTLNISTNTEQDDFHTVVIKSRYFNMLKEVINERHVKMAEYVSKS